MDVDQLADQLARNLDISSQSCQRKTTAMRSVNAASQRLSTVVQSGWKFSSSRSATLANVNACTAATTKALKELRDLCPKSLDVERAALSVVGKLISLEMFKPALSALGEMHQSLLHILNSEIAVVQPHPLHLLSIPLTPQSDHILLILICTYLSHTLTVISHLYCEPSKYSAANLSFLVETLSSSRPTLLSWAPQISMQDNDKDSAQQSKPADSILTRAYTALSRLCTDLPASTPPHQVYTLRIYALSLLAYTSPKTVAPNLVWNQAVKYAAVFFKSASAIDVTPATAKPTQNKITTPQTTNDSVNLVLESFDRLVECAHARRDATIFMQGKSFVAFCECWTSFAKKAGQVAVLDKITRILHTTPHSRSSETPGNLYSSKSPVSRNDSTIKQDAGGQGEPPSGSDLQRTADEVQGIRLCTVFAKTSVVLDRICNSASADPPQADDLQHVRDAITILSQLKANGRAQGKSKSHAAKACAQRDIVTDTAMDTSSNDTCKATSAATDGGYCSDVETRRKVWRALEHMRRSGIAVMEKLAGSTGGNSYVQEKDGQRLRQRKYITDLLESLLGVLETWRCENPPNVNDIYTQILDTLFVLSRTSLWTSAVAGRPVDDSQAFAYLERGLTILDLGLDIQSNTLPQTLPTPSSDASSSIDMPTYARCLAGAFYNAGATLYQDGRWGSAVKFVKAGCVVGEWALCEAKRNRQCNPGVNSGQGRGKDKGKNKVDSGKDRSKGEERARENTKDDDQEIGKDKAEQKEEGGWRVLEEQLFRRWELLGACWLKLSERKLAYEAFLQSVRAFPYSLTGFAWRTDNLHIGTGDTRNWYESHPSIAQLGMIVDRVTYIGGCELFLEPSQVSLLSLTRPSEGFKPDPKTLGALIERQLSGIEMSMWKEGVPRLVKGLLCDLVRVYESERMPIRRVRALTKWMAVAYYTDLGEKTNEISGDMDEVAEEVERLLSREELGDDSTLASSRDELRVRIHIWAALHAHRRADAAQTSIVRSRAEEVCRVLNGLMPGTSGHSLVGDEQTKGAKGVSLAVSKIVGKGAHPPPPLRGRSKPAGTTKGRKGVASGVNSGAAANDRTKSSRQTASRSNRSEQQAAEPVTPKRTIGSVAPLCTEEVISRVVSPKSPVGDRRMQSPVAELDNLVQLLQMLAHLLGFLGLTLTKVQILDVTRRLCESCAGVSNDSYITASVDLAHEYDKLGKRRKANGVYKRLLNVINAAPARISPQARVKFFLRYAESLAVDDHILPSAVAYCDAFSLLDHISVEEKGLSTYQRLGRRVEELERSAMACHVFAAIQYSRRDLALSLDGLLQSLRLWNRALDNLVRLISQPVPKTPESNPFVVSDESSSQEAAGSEKPIQKKFYQRRPAMERLEWRIVDGLCSTFCALTRTYFIRGSPREAEYFTQQALEFGESINAPAVICQAVARKGEIQICQGKTEEGYQSIVKASELVAQMHGTDTANVDRLRADYSQRNDRQSDAQKLYDQARRTLEDLDQTLSIIDVGSRRSLSSPATKNVKEVLAPELLAAILCRHIWLLRDDPGDRFQNLLDILMSLAPTQSTKAQKAALVAKLTMNNVYAQFRNDMFLSSVMESTIAIPMSTSSSETLVLTTSTQEILANLEEVKKLFSSELAFINSKGDVARVREAAMSLAMVGVLRTSLGKNSKEMTANIIHLLDCCSAVALRREIAEVIRHKFPQFYASDDLQWPLITNNGSPKRREKPRLLSAFRAGDSPMTINEDETEKNMKKYWETVHAQHTGESADTSRLTSAISSLPSHWAIVHISVTEDRGTMFVTRQQCGKQDRDPLIFFVPLQGRRENGEDNGEHLGFEEALTELRDIIRCSDESTRLAVNVTSNDVAAREQWWKQRKSLDSRLKELLENIEFCWLGAFKTILCETPNLSPAMISEFRTQIDKVFQVNLRFQQDKSKPKGNAKKRKGGGPSHKQLHIDDVLLECFSTLSPKCRDEEVEDLVYFILDLYQFHGIPIATAEVDITQMVVDLRRVLEEHANRLTTRKKSEGTQQDQHLFLVLDKNIQSIPWESLPVLRGRSVSRIPSVQFLLDRVHLASITKDGGKAGTSPPDRAVVDPRRAYYVLNPSGDLRRTEDRFKDWLKGMGKAGWKGVVGHAPSEQQLLDALSRDDLVVYFGHGGGEQYARSHKIRHLPRCAAVMLWGCSSGALREMGDFDCVGTPYNYMLAGCPTLVANLWDVTDKDIDKFSQSVFDKLRLNPRDVKGWLPGKDGQCSVVAAVSQSRDVCKLKYLTGAAPIVYGIPFYL